MLYSRLHDLSLDGMDALLGTVELTELRESMCFAWVEVNIERWGVFHFDAQLISTGECKVIDSKNETITTPRLSLRLFSVSSTVEWQLWRVIFSLKQEAWKRVDSVRD